MSEKINNIIDQLKSLTLLEAAELVKQIEEVFDVDASSVSNANMVMMPNNGDSTVQDEVEEKTEFDVILEEVPSTQKIPILKAVRSITALGLKEAKDLVDNVPKLVKEGISKDDADKIKKDLEEAGAKVSIK
uniref:50S ribosomal protein L12, chloroplastic n=1 Tax=Compsothamnion thuioides TaxID=3097386 RepID=A0A4D6WSN9_9FLOR|nr:ribosomal protein L12 [Compsothamnion thuyoides]